MMRRQLLQQLPRVKFGIAPVTMQFLGAVRSTHFEFSLFNKLDCRAFTWELLKAFRCYRGSTL